MEEWRRFRHLHSQNISENINANNSVQNYPDLLPEADKFLMNSSSNNYSSSVYGNLGAPIGKSFCFIFLFWMQKSSLYFVNDAKYSAVFEKCQQTFEFVWTLLSFAIWTYLRLWINRFYEGLW